jgi:hypothetical protein
MRRFLLLGLALLPLAPLAAPGQTESKAKPREGLAVGKDLPGPFHPYNATGPYARKFHCLLTQAGLDPLVLVFVREVEPADRLKDLFTALENAVAKNPGARLLCGVVFLTDALPEVVGESDAIDDQREVLENRLKQLAEGWGLKHVVLCLDSPKDVANYELKEDAVTIVLVNKARVVGLESLSKDGLTAEKVQALVAELAEKLGAKRK